MWGRRRTFCLSVLLVLLCCNGSLAAPPADTPNVLFRFDRRPDVVRARIGEAKLQRILRGSGFQSVDAMVEVIARDDDLGVDVASETLVYACMKPAPPRPTAEAVAAAAADTLVVHPVSEAEVDAKLAEAAAVSALHPAMDPATYSTAVDSVSSTDPAASNPTSEPEAPGHHRHHHHHRRRNLLQSSEEWLSPWHPDTADSATITTTAVFSLHSRPGATRRIFLDFDGHTVTGTSWNVNARDPIVMRPFDRDGSPTSWSQTERNQILAIWRGVAEDFAPWDVDVTTEDPGASYPLNQWIRHVIGVRPADYASFWKDAAGVAYLNAWGASTHYSMPSFTFAESNNYDTKAIIETASHEIGHNFGLNHDGDSTGEYAQGGNGWAPIMGFSDYQPTTQWSKGDYPGATNKQDDLAVIGGKLPLVANVHGTSNATATPVGGTLAADNVTMNAKVLGIIRSRTDVENMWFEARAGPATFEVLLTPSWSTGSLTQRTNMNVAIAVFNPAGTQLASYKGYGIPSFTLQLATPGRHLVRVFGLYPTTGSWATPGDFDDYASVGSYQLRASYQRLATTTPPPPPPPTPPPPTPPPPPPSTTQMTVREFVGRKTISSTSRVTCSVDITVVDNVNAGVVVSGASVVGRWSSASSASGFPTATQTVTTNTAGVATFTFPSTVTLPTSTQGCIFTITGITKSGVTLATGWTKVARQQW